MSTFNYASDEMQLGHPALATLAIGGPFAPAGVGDTPSRRRIFACHPASTRARDAERCAREILSGLVRRAYRRPASEDDLKVLLPFYEQGRQEGGRRPFAAGIQFALERILTDPEFLFRIEGRAPAGGEGQARALELASRLSFFLWSSIPDDQLIDAAVGGRLSERGTLEHEVRRMLADPRAGALPRNFGGQWLQLRHVRASNPDIAMFPEFDENLREAMQRETELFLEHQVRDDRGVLDLLQADDTFVNERLARHYGLTGVYGNHFRRVAHVDDRRKGLLGQASLLMVTSYPNRTSPVLRGAWLLETLLGSPPPPPPPDVPALPDRGEGGEATSVRARLEQHRRNPVCASCHRSIDPLGFALENFDPIGGWRTMNEGRTRLEPGAPVDSSGVLPDGTAFRGVVELRHVLVTQRREEFVATVVEQLFTYALGRGLDPIDMPAVRRIVRQSAAAGHTWSSIVLGIVRSDQFQKGRRLS
jgi:hypothetical protein